MTENQFCSLNLSLRSNQQLSSEKDPSLAHGQAERTAKKFSATKIKHSIGQMTTAHIYDWLTKVKQNYEPSCLLVHGSAAE